MTQDQDIANAVEYRREAAACLEVAERMSLHSDGARMMEMAQRWLELAKNAEARAAKQASGECAPWPTKTIAHDRLQAMVPDMPPACGEARGGNVVGR
jgi:hypothetical protein